MAPEVKKIKKAVEQATHRIKDAQQRDMGLIDNLLRACEGLNSEAAIGLLMKPESIMGLINTDIKNNGSTASTTHNFPCIYALHAIILILINDSRRKILNQMNEKQLQGLQQCINVATKYGRPQVDKILGRLTSENAKEHPNPETVSFLNKQLTIFQFVNDDWGDVVTELKKWSKSVDKRIAGKDENESETAEVADETQMYSLQELEEKMGYQSYIKFAQDRKRITEIYPYTRKWFVKKGTRVLFQSEHSAEFAKLLKNIQTESKPEKTEKAVKSQNNTGELQAAVDKLQKMFDEQTQAANSTKAKLDKARELLERKMQTEAQLRAINAEISDLMGV